MLTVVGADYNDGWAFVKRGGAIFLLKPPYLRSHMSVVQEEVVEKAIKQYGFESTDVTFSTWGELIGFLKEKLLENREREGIDVPETKSAYELLEHAPAFILKQYVLRVEKELIPNGEWGAAVDLLSNLIRVDAVREDTELHTQATGLLRRCLKLWQKAKRERQELLEDKEQLAKQFPDSSVKYGVNEISACIHQVREQQTIWP